MSLNIKNKIVATAHNTNNICKKRLAKRVNPSTGTP